METNDLMIGNYVYINGKVHELNIKKFQYAVCRYRCKDIKPIPLTEQWLIDFGFEKRKTNIYHDYVIDNFTIFTYQKTDFYFMFFSESGPDYRIQIKYVHQLQNLYKSLTDKQLTK